MLQAIYDTELGVVLSKNQMWAKLEKCFVLLKFFFKNKKGYFCFQMQISFPSKETFNQII